MISRSSVRQQVTKAPRKRKSKTSKRLKKRNVKRRK